MIGSGRVRLALLVLLCTLVRGTAVAAPDALRIGMVGALSGPAAQLGSDVRRGIEAHFALVNERGGVHGRKLELVALDDAYEPRRTGPAMRKLIDEEQVLAVLGNPGTPTAAVAVPIANEKRVPLVGALTGAALLRREPPDRYVFNYRASYAEETAEMVRGLVQELGVKPEELAFFTQDDAYGEAGFRGAVAALEALGYAEARSLPHGRYPRNTLDVEGALARLLDPAVHPRAVIMVGASRPSAKLIRLAKQHRLRVLFVNVSFVIGDQLVRELGDAAENVVVTQVVPPLDADLPLVREYRARVSAQSFVSLEGFVAAKALVWGLERAGPSPTRERLVDALEGGEPLDLGLGEPCTLSKTKHQLSSRVWPTVVKHGRLVALRAWSDLAPQVQAR